MTPVPRALQELVNDAARALNRSLNDVQPFAQILADNWFDGPSSLAGCKAEELAALGIPLRFAQQLLVAVSAGSPETQRRKQSPPGRRQQSKGGGREQGPQQKVLKVRGLDPAFHGRGVILGAKGRNVHHIEDETGVKVDVRGDSGEPMELVFTDAPSATALQQAMQMGKDLLGWVLAQYDDWQREHGLEKSDSGPVIGRRESKGSETRSGKGGGSKAGRNKDAATKSGADKCADAEFQHCVEIAESDGSFTFRGKLLGRQGKNVREIEQKTGAIVQVKGDSGEPMRLELGASSPEALHQATELAEDLVAKVYAEYDEWLADGGPKRRAAGPASDCEFTQALELQECDTRFALRGKVLGPGGRRLHRIEEETGARLELQDTSQLLVGASSQEVLDIAVKAAEELLSEVYDSYAEWLQSDAAGADDKNGNSTGRGKRGGRAAAEGGGGRMKATAKGGSRGPGPSEFKKILKLKECDPEFDLRNQLRGTKCENLHHVQDETRSRLWVVGERSEPVRLEISAHTLEDLDEAVRMAKDLIKAVFNDYNQWLRQKEAGIEPQTKRQRLGA